MTGPHAEDVRPLMAGRPQTARSIIIRSIIIRSIIIRSIIIWSIIIRSIIIQQGQRRAVDEGSAWTDGARHKRRREGMGDAHGWGMMARRYGKGVSDMARS